MNPTHATSEAAGFIPAPGDKGKPITVIGTNSIRAGFDATCLQQALNARGAPGVTDLVLNPDAHVATVLMPDSIPIGPAPLWPVARAQRGGQTEHNTGGNRSHLAQATHKQDWSSI